MTHQELKKLIRKTIQNVAFDNLKQLKNQIDVKKTESDLNSSKLSEDDVDLALFNGGYENKENKKRSPIKIHENTNNNLKITSSEIKQFENSFQQILEKIPGASIVFLKQNNSYSMMATKRPDGVEAKASGIINLGEDGKINWFYSLLNGFKISAQNIKLTDENKSMFELMANHYNDWQKKWREILNLPSAPKDDATEDQKATYTPSTPPGGGAGTMASNSQAGAIDSNTMGM
jgi:hypothetical protein